MKLFYKILIAATVVGVGLAGLLTVSVAAEDPNESITLSPVSKDYSLEPGQVIKDYITVLNDGKTAYDFTVYATPYSVQDEQYNPDFSDTPPNADAYTWIEFEKTTYHAKPRESVRVPFTVRVKDDSVPGGHYGAIFVEMESADGSQLARKKRVGSILYATVAGDIVREGAVDHVSTKWFQTRPPIQSELLVSNTGTTDFRTPTKLEVKDVFGRTVYKQTYDYAVLPGTSRRISLEWPGASWFGLYKVEVSAEALKQTTKHSSYVLIVPTWLIALISVFIASGGLYALNKRVRQKA